MQVAGVPNLAGAVTAYVGASLGIGGFTPTEALQFGAVSGIANTISGGKFGHGFISAYVSGVVNASGVLKGVAGWRLYAASSIIGGTVSAATGGKFANGAAFAAFASIVAEGIAQSSTAEEVALDEGGGISGTISDEQRTQATERLQEVLNIAEANGDELTAVYARRALNHGLQFDENMAAAARINTGGKLGEASPNFGRTTIGKSFFYKGTNTELMANFPNDGALLASQSFRIQQVFRLRHELAHLSYSNRKILPYGPRTVNPQEIDASRQAFDWTKRYLIK